MSGVAGGVRRGRAFTLLELLIAIALLLAIAAVAIPSLVRDLDDRGFDAAIETVVGQLLLARAHAQSNAMAVEVWYRSGPPRVEARPFDPAAGGLPGDPAFVDDDAAATPLTATIGEAWALRTLPRDMRLTGVPPADPGGERGPWNDFDEPAEAEASIRLVVYLPDGSALLRTTTWFVDEAETRRVRLEVSGFTGVPTHTTVDPDADPEAAPDAEPEEADGARGRRGPGDPRAPGLQPFAGDPP